jgi:1,4-dihydroxy-2-naphthoate polyprenyltransferase
METGARRERIFPVAPLGDAEEEQEPLAELAAYGDVPAAKQGVARQWLTLARAATLALPLAPVLATLSLLWSAGAALQPLPAASIALGAALVLLGANVLDEYLEFERASGSDWFAADDARFFAGHTLADSDVRPLSALRAGLGLLSLGALAGVPAMLAGGARVLALGAAGLFVAFLYSATSFALKRLPASELILALALGPGIACATIFAERRPLSLHDMLPGIALGLFTLSVVEALHLRDAAAAAAAGRWTLAAALRGWPARANYTFGMLGAFGIAAYLALVTTAEIGALAALLALPGASVALTGVLRAQSTAARHLAARQTLRAYTTFAILLVLGLLAGDVLVRWFGLS